MKRIKNYLLTVLLFLMITPVLGQYNNNLTVFHRILLYNDANELLIVKIKNTDIWVTPGLYQNKTQDIKKGLDSIVATYGVMQSEPILKGVFTLQRKTDSTASMSVRNLFVSHVQSYRPKVPDIIEEVKWVSPAEAAKMMSFPHISEMILQTSKYQQTLWGGAFTIVRSNGKTTSEMSVPFYSLGKQK